MDLRIPREHILEKAGVCSKLFFCWILPLLLRGKRKALEPEDIDPPVPSNRASHLSSKCYNAWNRNKPTKASTFLVLFKVFGLEYVALGIVLLIKDVSFKLSQGIWLGFIVLYFGGPYAEQEGFILTGGLILSIIFYTLVHHSITFQLQDIGLRMQGGISCLVYRKALKLSTQSLGKPSFEQLTKELSEDLRSLGNSWTHIHYLWIAPIFTAGGMFILWQLFGFYCFSGLVMLVVFHLPIKALIHYFIRKYRATISKQRSIRVDLMQEIIRSVALVKMNAWEAGFSDAVLETRKLEVNGLRKLMIFRAFDSTIGFVATNVSVICVLLGYMLIGNSLSAEKVFVALVVFHQMVHVLTKCFPRAISQVCSVRRSLKRIDKFLALREREFEQPVFQETVKTYAGFRIVSNQLTVEKVTASWENAASGNWPTLEDVSLEVKSGQLVAIVGPVGCGKSTLLKAILQELPCRYGSIVASGKVAYVSQDPWLTEGSIQENILFGKAFEDEWYDCIVDACALRKDLNSFPHGDRTFVGENGFKLSVSQRVRINLARVLYADADIVLVDDLFSLVDVHVGRHLFDKCILGILRRKAVLLATHQVHFLQPADQIIALTIIGSIKTSGTYAELLQNGAFQFSHGKYFQAENILALEQDNEVNPGLDRSWSNISISSHGSNSKDDRPLIDDGKGEAKYGTFNVKWTDSKNNGEYSLKEFQPFRRRTCSSLRAGNGCCRLLLVLSFSVIAQILSSGAYYWLQFWSGEDDFRKRFGGDTSRWLTPWHKVSDMTFLEVYGALVLATFLIFAFSSILFLKLGIRSSISLHTRLLKSVLGAPMQFFNANPTGTIANIFSKDVNAADEKLPVETLKTITAGLEVVGAVILVSLMSPVLVVPSTVLVFLVFYIRNFFLKNSASLIKLAENAKLPAQSQLLSTLNGLTTIRAFDMAELCTAQFYAAQDIHSSTLYTLLASFRWFAIQIDWLLVIYIAITTFSFMIFPSHTDGATVGLAIFAAMTLFDSLDGGLSQSIDMDYHTSSFERITEYSKVGHENRRIAPADSQLPPSWPSKGGIRVHSLTLKYSGARLHDISFSIAPTEKIAIVDKTGGGTKCLIAALYRLAEPSSGFVLLDDVNIRQIGLQELRSQISYIPQDPILFLGNLRGNLDPLDVHDDEDLIQVLRQVNLLEKYQSHPKALLDSVVSEEGSNFSVGERLLIYLARALLRKNRIVLFHETTLNVDSGDDILVQKTIRDSFEDCTVLTIAHRLQTVLDSDRVIFLDEGAIVEMDKPYNLLQDNNSKLLELVGQSGTPEAWMLHQLASAVQVQ